MKTTQMHLHHVVNCLVGPQGEGFDASLREPVQMAKVLARFRIPRIAPRRHPCTKPFQQTLDGLKQSDMAAASEERDRCPGSF